MGALYEYSKDEDGFLYVAYSGENTFGFQKGPERPRRVSGAPWAEQEVGLAAHLTGKPSTTSVQAPHL